VNKGGLLSAELYKLYIEDLLKSYENSKASSNAMQIRAFLSEYSLYTSSIMMAEFNGEMFVVKPRWSGQFLS
jgi:hypothetical protein